MLVLALGVVIERLRDYANAVYQDLWAQSGTDALERERSCSRSIYRRLPMLSRTYLIGVLRKACRDLQVRAAQLW